MAITIQERELMHNGIVRPLSQILATKNEYTWATKPTAAAFGRGQAWFSDIGAMGYSDGVSWTVPSTDNNATFVLFGDSRTSNINRSVGSLSSVVRSGNMVTVSASQHFAKIGQKLKVSNLLPDDFNGIYTVTTESSGSFTYISEGTQGAATITGYTHPSGGGAELKILDNLAGNGMWLWLNGLMDGGLQLVLNCARGGWKASYMASVIDDIEAEITATGKIAKNAYISMGINDVNGGRTSAQIIASLTALITHNKNMGRRVFITTIEPYGTGHASFTADKNATLCAVNKWILIDAPALLGVYPINTYQLVVSPQTGALKTNMSNDNVHMGYYAYMDVIAPAIKNVVSKYITTQSPLPLAATDTYGASVNSTNLIDIAPWTTTGGGSILGNVTPGGDNVIAGWTLDEVGSGTVTASIATNDAGYVEQVVELTAVAANDRAELHIPFDVTRFVVGTKHRICFKIELANLDTSTGNISQFGSYIEIKNNSVTGYQYICAYGPTYLLTGILTGTKTFTLVSEPILITSTMEILKLHIRIVASGASIANAVMKISQVGTVPV